MVLSYYALAIPLRLNVLVLFVVIVVIIVIRLWCFFEQLLDGFRGVNELFQIVIQTGQVILPSLVVGNQFLFPLQKFLSLLLQCLALGSFVIDAGHHQCVVIIVCVFGVLGEELL